MKGHIVASPAAGQKVEMALKTDADQVTVLGGVDSKTYPLAKKRHGVESKKGKLKMQKSDFQKMNVF